MQDDSLVEYDFHCPYCDSALTFLIDVSQGSHLTWEDCHHCCAPIQVAVDISPLGDEIEQIRTGTDDDVL